MEKQQNKIFANCSQTVHNHCEFRNELATSFALGNPIAPLHCTLAKFASHKTYAKFRIAKIRNEFANQFRNAKISQCQIRNAKISQCQIRNANFAMPNSISQCQFQIRNANTLFICLTIKSLAKFRIAKFRIAKFANHFAKFANPFRIANFTSFAKFTFAGLVILCN